MDRSKYLIKNVGLLTISNFSSKILVFLLVPLYTSVLTTAEYGTYDLIISTISLLYPLFTLNIVDGVMRFVMDNNSEKRSVISIGFATICISMVITGILTYCLHLAGIWKGLLVYFLLYYVFYTFNQFFIQTAKGLERVQDMAIAGVISTVSMLLGNVLLLLVFHMGLSGFFVANILSQGLSALFFCVRIKVWRYTIPAHLDKRLGYEMLLYSMPLIATALGWWVNNTLDKYAVAFLCGVAANGLLSVSYKIPSILNVAQQIFIQAWQISAIKEYGEHDTSRFYGKTFSMVNMMMCAFCAGLIFLTRPLAHILYAKDFYTAWCYVPFLLVSSVFNCAAGLLGPVLSAKKDTKTMMWSAIIGAIMNAVFNIVLILMIGVQGAVIATALSSFVIFAVRLYGTRKDIIIEDKFYITWLLLILQATVEVTIGNRVIELMLCAIMFFVNKENICAVVEKCRKILSKKGW